MKGSGQRLAVLERTEACRVSKEEGEGRRKASCPGSGAAGGRWEGGTSVRATAGQGPDGRRKEAGRKTPGRRLTRGCCSGPGKEGCWLRLSG